MANRSIGSYESCKMCIFGSAIDRDPRIIECNVSKPLGNAFYPAAKSARALIQLRSHEAILVMSRMRDELSRENRLSKPRILEMRDRNV